MKCCPAVVLFGFVASMALSEVSAQKPRVDQGPVFGSEDAHTFKVKDVAIDEVDENTATVSVSYGKREKRSRLVDLQAAKEIKIVGSNVFPSVGNNIPFSWEDMKSLVDKRVSIKVRTESSDLVLVSVCRSND